MGLGYAFALGIELSPVQTLAYSKIANPFTGILAGVIGGICYNKFKDTKLPDVLAFFSGKTSVQVIIGPKVQFVHDEFKTLCQ